MTIKRILPVVALAIALTACNKPAGELVGAGKNGNFKEANPYGMIFIKKGSFMMGSNTQSAVFSQPDNQLMVTVDAFWMDETEITNNEYRQFVNWVRDSIAYKNLIEAGLTDYAIQPRDGDFDEENYRINWKKRIPWNSKEEDVQDALASMFYEDGNLNTTRFHYSYSWINYDEAVLPRNRFDVVKGAYPEGASVRVDTAWIDEDGIIHDSTVVRSLTQPSDLITRMIINVYPDTMVWMRDFQFAYNEPMLQQYFSHPGFADYPVVGITWEQADAFCQWRTDYFLGASTVAAQKYRLPTEAEWEYAARGGRKMATYPWGGNYARDAKGCFLANFKPYRGSYIDDTGAATMKVAQFRPNDFGLFDMAGNVAEWTSSAYNASANSYVHDLNPQFQYRARKEDPEVLKRKVVKGGSWKDISYYLQCGTRTYEYQYESRPYIGFRCVRSYIGEK
ncbi:MAG: SUMF1/EgtB/PvdO family nonheme iron enzyme [Paludibacteraceae bacterium]|nr:SUMF1/EgtB/PvdO family nonheme iron enzyme [Paludibacteraceae bacterium]